MGNPDHRYHSFRSRANVSTRIIGYRFPTMPMSDLHTYLYDLRTRVLQKANELVSRWFIEELIEALDTQAITGEWPEELRKYATDNHNQLYFVLKEKIRQKIVDAWSSLVLKVELIRYDLRAGLSLFFDDKWIYAIPEFNNIEIGEILRSAPGMEDYTYDTSTDDLPEMEAADRGEKWDALIGRAGVISHRGIKYEAVNYRSLQLEIRFPGFEDILKSTPEPVVRAEQYALDEAIKHHIGLPREEPYRLVAVVTNARKWATETVEGREFVAAERDRVAALLKSTFTPNELLVKIPMDTGGNDEKSRPAH